jgi:hypothetical protein
MKIRLIEEYSPIDDSTVYKIQRKELLGGWWLVDLSVDERKARELWERAKAHGIRNVIKVLAEAEI